MTAGTVGPGVYHEAMREPDGDVLVEDEYGELWRPNSDRKWICQTDQGWTNTWEEFLSRHEPVSIYVDREWLYGRKPDDVDDDGRAEWQLEPFLEVISVPGAVIDIDGREHSPDGAIEYARALLAAAEAAKPD